MDIWLHLMDIQIIGKRIAVCILICSASGMPMMYPQQYGSYYNPYMQYGAYYNYSYPQYTSPPAPTLPTTSTAPSLPVGYTGATTNQSTTTTSSSIYATTNSKQTTTNTVGGA